MPPIHIPAEGADEQCLPEPLEVLKTVSESDSDVSDTHCHTWSLDYHACAHLCGARPPEKPFFVILHKHAGGDEG